MNAVVFERVEERFGRCDVVDRDDVEVTAHLGESRDGSTDAPESVDGDLGYGRVDLLDRKGRSNSVRVRDGESPRSSKEQC